MKVLNISGKQVKVDDEDQEWLEMVPWHVNSGYCKRHFGLGRMGMKLFMHKLIMGVYDPKTIVDHIDRDKLNNQKSNLRLATRHQNGYNRCSHKGSSSKYLGVIKRYNGVWLTQITTNNITKSVGTFKTEREAAIYYNLMASLLHGEFASLNIIA